QRRRFAAALRRENAIEPMALRLVIARQAEPIAIGPVLDHDGVEALALAGRILGTAVESFDELFEAGDLRHERAVQAFELPADEILDRRRFALPEQAVELMAARASQL